MKDVNESSRTELDSHTNMPVIGRNAYILSKIGGTVDVAPFTTDYKPISVELVDAALKYECPYSGKVKVLIIRRELHVPSMTHNLLPPFMLREAGIQIIEVPNVEKPLLSIGLISSCADQFDYCALLQSRVACLHVSFTTYEYFYKLSRSALFSRWLLHPVTQKNQ